MPLDYARSLTGEHRTDDANRRLGGVLAFIAGAVNAGAFLAVHQYTSHMTGIVSSLADALAFGDVRLAASAFGAVASFLLGAIACAVLVNYARRRHWRSQYALPLLVEASLLLVFGSIGARLASIDGLFVPATVSLLCFIMGLQNAVISKISRSEIRTTHVTGLLTDLGIELGKLFYWNRLQPPPALRVVANRERLRVLSLLILAFATGGVVGAIGFEYAGYATTVPLAVALIALAGVPAVDDMRSHFDRKH